MARWWEAAAAIWLWGVCPVFGGEQMVVGMGGMPWTLVGEETSFLGVARDSVWLWRVEPGENLAVRALAHGGRIFAVEERADQFGRKYRELVDAPGLERMLDGDEETAFDPDADGGARQLEIYVDLGGYYEVDEIRFHPRLDSGHRGRFPQAFELGSNRLAADGDPLALAEEPFSLLINRHPFQPNDQSVVVWPQSGEIAEPMEMRYVRIKTLVNRPWEIAELEVAATGKVPPAEFLSRPLTVPGGSPVWGRLRYQEGDVGRLPVLIQTRTGPDPEPVHYFLSLIKSGGLRQVTKQAWENSAGFSGEVQHGEARQGPVLPNPLWSRWETVTDGLVLSPSPQEYIQFRLRMSVPGLSLEKLIFEYTSWPLAQVLEAEISPVEVTAGEAIPFTLSLQAQRLEDNIIPTSGFRRLQVSTPAEIIGVDRVLVQDREVFHTFRRETDGFSLEFWERVRAEGSFVQIFFRGRVFADGTQFRVQAIDERASDGEVETIYQFARPGDVEPRTPGGELTVRLNRRDAPLVGVPDARVNCFTPNGDGINDFFELSYELLKLTRPAAVRFEIFDLDGRRVRQGYVGEDASGGFLRIWDGLDGGGRRTPPGNYLYRLEVETDAETVVRHGVVGLTY